MFSLLLFTGWFMILLQALAAYTDGGGWLTQAQMRSHGSMHGYSFMEHGGMWADWFLVTPIAAYVLSHYKLHVLSVHGMVILAILIVFTGLAGRMYVQAALRIPEAHTHDGITTTAGWIHGIYAVIALWTIVTLYFTVPSSELFRRDIIWISCLLTPFFYLGIRKFNPSWHLDATGRFQSIAGPIIVWAIVGVRLYIIKK